MEDGENEAEFALQNSIDFIYPRRKECIHGKTAGISDELLELEV